MSRFNIVFNYQQGYVAFKANKRTFKTTFERDMSGMIVSARGKNFDEFIVEKVYVGSPAQNAGIIAGDELLMVDYRMANFLDLSVIHKSFTKGNGKNISLLVRRKNELLKIELTLRRMI
jgi:C-terminal processing protease CtpA/Prc